MVATRTSSEEQSPDRNSAAEDAEKELEYLDQEELLRLSHQDSTTDVNSVSVQPTPQATAASWFAPPTHVGEPALTRSQQTRRGECIFKTHDLS